MQIPVIFVMRFLLKHPDRPEITFLEGGQQFAQVILGFDIGGLSRFMLVGHLGNGRFDISRGRFVIDSFEQGCHGFTLRRGGATARASATTRTSATTTRTTTTKATTTTTPTTTTRHRWPRRVGLEDRG